MTEKDLILAVIIRNDGKEQKLADWQIEKGFQKNIISENIILDFDNVTSDNEMILSEKIIEVFEAIRKKWEKPLKINSGYRTERKQEQLRKNKNYKGFAAVHSPHCYGFALDIDTKSKEETKELLKVVREIRKHFPYMRIGWQKYLEAGATFIHIDVAPYFFGEKGIWKNKPCPNDVWRYAGLEW